MALALVHTRAGLGLDAPSVRVEVHLAGGLPRFTLVGLPETAVRESRERVRAALQNCGFTFPARAVTANLAPADLPKEGGRYDLALALGLLAAAELIPRRAVARLDELEVFGELALTGELRPVRGILPAIRSAAAAGRTAIVPEACAAEASLAAGAKVLVAGHLNEVVAHLTGEGALTEAQGHPPAPAVEWPDLADVRGQPAARRALEVAAAGGHNLLMVGPPGTGKTMLVHRLPGLLPAMDASSAATVASIWSLGSTGFDPDAWRRRPFRAPHHTASHVAMVGGGAHPRPGEISLSHGGVLFLDELPEFSRRVLEVLREPLESGEVSLSRAGYKVTLPADFQLVAAMNPCPCGYLGDGTDRCECPPGVIARYRSRLSGPLLDRIDLHVEVPQQSLKALRRAAPGEPTETVRERVLVARRRQLERAGDLNARLGADSVDRHCRLGESAGELLESAADRLGLSARACARILKVARTIADLEGADTIATSHLLEAIGYRSLDRTSRVPGIDANVAIRT